MTQTLGQVINNPLNIRTGSKPWRGQQDSKKGFCKFESKFYGYRAAFITLHAYFYKHGIKTIEGIVNRWAPPVENNVRNYIEYVTTVSGLGKTQELDFCNMRQMCFLVKAMAGIESASFDSFILISDVYKSVCQEKKIMYHDEIASEYQ